MPRTAAQILEVQQERLAIARRELALFPGAARLDGISSGRDYLLMWSGITEAAGGIVIRTDDWKLYAAVAREFLEFDAIKPYRRRRHALEPARRPAGRALANTRQQIASKARAGQRRS
jgi:hypothetical protein